MRTVPDYRGIHVMTLLSQSRARKKVPVRSPAVFLLYFTSRAGNGEPQRLGGPVSPIGLHFLLLQTPLCSSPSFPPPLFLSLFHFSCQLRVDSLAGAKIHSSPRLIFCGFCSFPCSGQGSSTRTRAAGWELTYPVNNQHSVVGTEVLKKHLWEGRGEGGK